MGGGPSWSVFFLDPSVRILQSSAYSDLINTETARRKKVRRAIGHIRLQDTLGSPL